MPPDNPMLTTLLLLTGALPLAPMAQTLDLRIVQTHYDSAEKLPGGFVFNRETGTLRGPGLRAAAAWAGVEAVLDAEQLRGTIDYAGFTQFGIPLQTTTVLRWRQASVELAPAAPPAWGRTTLRPALALAGLQIERAIQASAASVAVTETLHRRQAAVGTELSHSMGAWTLRAGVGAAWPLSQRLEVDTFGLYDAYSLAPRSGRARWLRAGAVGRFEDRWRLTLEVERHGHRFGSSDSALVTRAGQPAATSFYPGSSQWLTRTVIAFGYDWP